MNPRQYIDLKDDSRDLQPTYHFMINCLLYSRMETGLVSNADCYDEDVNVYLAHLLHAFINPEYVEQSRKFLSKYDSDVFRRLSTSTDARLKYQIFKTNADFLGHIIEVGHGSVLEHGVWSFVITGASRSFTHELIRHRHFSYSQLSQRYVDESHAAFVVPPAIMGDDALVADWKAQVESAQATYVALVDKLIAAQIARAAPEPGKAFDNLYFVGGA